MVICGKNKNLNKIIENLRISLKIYRPLILVVLFSLELDIVEHTV